MDAKKIVALVMSIILIAALAFSLTWTIVNWNKVKDGMGGAGLYTKDDVDNSYEDGYNTALDDKSQYEDLIAEYRDKLSEYEEIKKELTVAKYNIAELNNTVNKLQSYVAECEELIKNLTAENFMLKDKIRILEEIKTNLMQSVNAYVQLIASIKLINERFVVTFMFDDTVYSILLVPDKEKVELVNPTSTEYTIFLGWSLTQDGELVDLENLEVTSDMVFYAKIIRKYDVNFVLDYAIYEHKIVERGNTITAKTPPSTNKRVFKGWSLDGVNVINVTNYPITEHRTFFAVVETRYEVRFIYVRNNYMTYTLSTQYVGPLSKVTVPGAPSFNGYRFDGWMLNGGNLVNPSTYTVTSDTVFVARYTANYVTVNSTYRFGASSNGMYSQTSILDYLRNNGHGYVANMQMLKSFSIVVRVYAGNHNGATYYLSQNTYSVHRVPCWGISEWFASGTLFYSIGLMANGMVQLQLTFEGGSLLNNSVFGGCQLEIVSMSFTLNDF